MVLGMGLNGGSHLSFHYEEDFNDLNKYHNALNFFNRCLLIGMLLLFFILILYIVKGTYSRVLPYAIPLTIFIILYIILRPIYYKNKKIEYLNSRDIKNYRRSLQLDTIRTILIGDYLLSTLILNYPSTKVNSFSLILIVLLSAIPFIWIVSTVYPWSHLE
ncbi:MAG: hypothetical protein JSW00_07050 [Thermoplasmata archaeon]|nr:MAG: hypothetical protein JSW00_07050 [Thermoplasmata archaeon]